MYGGKFVLTELYSAWAELKEPYRKVYGKFPVTVMVTKLITFTPLQIFEF